MLFCGCLMAGWLQPLHAQKILTVVPMKTETDSGLSVREAELVFVTQRNDLKVESSHPDLDGVYDPEFINTGFYKYVIHLRLQSDNGEWAPNRVYKIWQMNTEKNITIRKNFKGGRRYYYTINHVDYFIRADEITALGERGDSLPAGEACLELRSKLKLDIFMDRGIRRIKKRLLPSGLNGYTVMLMADSLSEVSQLEVRASGSNSCMIPAFLRQGEKKMFDIVADSSYEPGRRLDAVEPDPIVRQLVEFVVEPEKAILRFDGQPLAVRNGKADTVVTEIGLYPYHLSCDSYCPMSGFLRVDSLNGKEVKRIRLCLVSDSVPEEKAMGDTMAKVADSQAVALHPSSEGAKKTVPLSLIRDADTVIIRDSFPLPLSAAKGKLFLSGNNVRDLVGVYRNDSLCLSCMLPAVLYMEEGTYSVQAKKTRKYDAAIYTDLTVRKDSTTALHIHQKRVSFFFTEALAGMDPGREWTGGCAMGMLHRHVGWRISAVSNFNFNDQWDASIHESGEVRTDETLFMMATAGFCFHLFKPVYLTLSGGYGIWRQFAGMDGTRTLLLDRTLEGVTAESGLMVAMGSHLTVSASVYTMSFNSLDYIGGQFGLGVCF